MLTEARAQGRIGKVAADPLLPLRAFIDIGGSGAHRRCLHDLDRAMGRQRNPHSGLLRGGRPGAGLSRQLAARARLRTRRSFICRMTASTRTTSPASATRITARRRLHRRAAGEEPGQGRGDDAHRGAAPARPASSGGTRPPPNRAATRIGFYHERKDDARNVGLGPEHDWSSHAADALGLMAICYEEPGRAGSFNRAIRYREQGWV